MSSFWPPRATVITLAASMLVLTGCSSLRAVVDAQNAPPGPPSLPQYKIGDSVSMPAGTGESEATVDVAVTAFEEAPAPVLKKLKPGTDLWFATVTFGLKGELGPTDWQNPWDQVEAFLADGTVLDTMAMGLPNLGACENPSEKTTAAAADYAAGTQVEMCVPIFGDDKQELKGVYFGPDMINTGVTWVK